MLDLAHSTGMRSVILTGLTISCCQSSLCPNKTFGLSLERLFHENSGPPFPHLRESDAVAAAIRELRGRRTLEIGGPSLFAESLYAAVAGLDLEQRGASQLFTNVVYPLMDIGDDGKLPIQDGDPFIGPHGWILGETIVRHGANLHGVPDKHFGAVFSSHNLEHFLDPLSALFEWDRVLQPGGLLMLILPFAPKTFDHGRSVASAQELMWLHSELKSSSSNDSNVDREVSVATLEAVKERMLAERVEKFISAFPPWEDDVLDAFKIRGAGRDPSVRAAALRARLLSRCADVGAESIEAASGVEAQLQLALNQDRCRRRLEATVREELESTDASLLYTSNSTSTNSDSNQKGPHRSLNSNNNGDWLVDESAVHWHVFDFNLLIELIQGCMGYELQWVDYQDPFHQIVQARKPHR
eukprot:CAMPEP_0171751988 /NCGR_PEP_ID=MMETSP0991-20121206/42341_1 /TAXON_ID=483369 /ORGANISM="non described non described, Strain CCMP2098" /LENGTH=412 /DNA_ID=CAMNT_0012353271 /DNA_START=137 /DNA_END=1375 /DNA_ORIENTATION=+